VSGNAPLPENLQAAKKSLRERIIAQRNALDASERHAYSATIVERLLRLPEYREASIVAAYAAFGSELDTAVFLEETLAAGKQLLLPRINKAERQLELRRVNDPAADLVAGVWGIREPGDHCPQLPAATVDFILVPGVAFTARGERLGYGGGFYDRLLAGVRSQVCRTAGAFSLQMVEHLPTGDRDQRVNCVVTELKTLRP
jgi:5,10-methenyltetrahydrofolate synthetase